MAKIIVGNRNFRRIMVNTQKVEKISLVDEYPFKVQNSPFKIRVLLSLTTQPCFFSKLYILTDRADLGIIDNLEPFQVIRYCL